VRVASATAWSAVSAGHWHTVALDTGGAAWGWGAGHEGQLGDDTINDRSTPVRVK
jgi:alpha-tubulin suppressor-like RCC1 family protein